MLQDIFSNVTDIMESFEFAMPCEKQNELNQEEDWSRGADSKLKVLSKITKYKTLHGYWISRINIQGASGAWQIAG